MAPIQMWGRMTLWGQTITLVQSAAMCDQISLALCLQATTPTFQLPLVRDLHLGLIEVWLAVKNFLCAPLVRMYRNYNREAKMISYSEHKYRVSVEGSTIDIKEVKKSLGLPLDDSKLYVWLPAIPSAGDLIDFGTEYRVDNVSLSPVLEMPDSTVYSGDDAWVARFANGECIGSKVHATVYL